MKFNSEAERLKHRQARLIPYPIWCDKSLFNCELSPAVLTLMRTNTRKLVRLLATSPHRLTEQEKKTYWLAITLTRKLNPDLFHQITNALALSQASILALTLKLGELWVLEGLSKRSIPHRKLSENLKFILMYQNYAALQYACLNGQLSDVIKVVKLLRENEINLRHILRADEDFLFQETLRRNRQDIVMYLLHVAEKSNANVQDMLIDAMYSGYFEVLDFAAKFALEKRSMEILECVFFPALLGIASKGSVPLARRLVSVAATHHLSLKSSLIKNEYQAFNWAASGGHVSLASFFVELAATYEISIKKMIEAHHYSTFGLAAANGYLDSVNYLIELAQANSVDIQAMVESKNFAAFKKAAKNNFSAVINRLLFFPTVFAHAEKHHLEYPQFVHPFVDEQIRLLRTLKIKRELDGLNTEFDVPEQDAKLYFYFVRNLIRRNDPDLHDDLHFLLQIPAVKALAHQAVTPNESNELVRLALTCNQYAAEILLTIPAVSNLAEEHNFYQNEMQVGVDSTLLSRDRESAMRALSPGEQKRLDAAIKQYQPRVNEKGLFNVMAELRQTLKARYDEHPAQIVRNNGSVLRLPQEWGSLQKLHLSTTRQPNDNESEYERALKAYYQHTDHTAWRYLSKPNHWMHEQAEYVRANPEKLSERWAAFEAFQRLIAVCFLAAKDEEMPPCDGHTLATRLNQFIAELAYLGRTHNWDDTRHKTDADGNPVYDDEGKAVEEEFDNLQADRPSCASGVKRRLFQSVPGHRLFQILTREIIKAELRDFVRQSFMNAITNKNRANLRDAWKRYINQPNNNDLMILKELDISEERQVYFITFLEKKYGEQFTQEPTFREWIKSNFRLKSPNEAHALNFGYVNLKQLLKESTAAKSLSVVGIFRPTPITSASEIDNTIKAANN